MIYLKSILFVLLATATPQAHAELELVCSIKAEGLSLSVKGKKTIGHGTHYSLGKYYKSGHQLTHNGIDYVFNAIFSTYSQKSKFSSRVAISSEGYKAASKGTSVHFHSPSLPSYQGMQMSCNLTNELPNKP